MRVLGRQEITPDMERLIDLIRNKEIVLWAGSGLSLYAGYPSGTEFCDIICNAAKTAEDKAILLKHKASLMNIAEEFEQLYSRDELMGLVSTCFDKPPCVEPYVHYLCTQIPQIDTIITTNYEHLFEHVYGDNLSTVVGTHYKTDSKKPVTLYKIHGDSSDSASVVLTSKDYAKFYECLDSLVWNKLKVILAERSVLFIGYSFEDKNIEDIFEKVLTQVDTSKSEFFIAVPDLAEHKLRHFNTICKTTHLPINGETLLPIIEEAVRENIVFDAIDKKISIDQAHSIANKYGIQPTWRSVPNGEKTKIEVENYIVNPFWSLTTQGITITSSPETVEQIEQFLEDCDCRELRLPFECLTLFENINGINIPKTPIDGERPDIVEIKKPEQVDEVVLTVENNNICKESVTLCSFWGSKRKRVTIQLSAIRISVLFEENAINVSLSFLTARSTQETLDDLSILDLWRRGNTLIFSKKSGETLNPVFQMPPIEDESIVEMLSNYISQNQEIHSQIKKLENYLKTDFLLPQNLTHEDRIAVLEVLSVFEPMEVGDKLNFCLSAPLDSQLYEALKSPADSSMDVTQTVEENINLFGHEYIIKERKISILSPVIENADEIGHAILAGEQTTAKIVSANGKLVLRCKL